jgi:hypothetical protein
MAILVLFVLVEKYVAREPIMPLKVLFSRTPAAVALACWFISMSQFGISELLCLGTRRSGGRKRK